MSTTTLEQSKSRQVRILHRRIGSIRPSPENAKLYRPVDPNDPEIIELAKSLRQHGVQEPLVVTRDGWIISGHRRHAAAKLAGLNTVPCRVEPVLKDRDHDQFMTLLRECNRQRVKSRSEHLREEVLSVDPEEAYQALIEHRQEQAVVTADTIAIRGKKRRAKISKAKSPMLHAVQGILEHRRKRKLLPVSVRKIHYVLLNDPPLKHASKPRSKYRNVRNDYQNLDDLLVRARLEGLISWNAICDETRPVITWNVHSNVERFLRTELGGFLKGYWRDLMQSQPNQVEIIGEKLTVEGDIKPVAMKYCIPYTLGRGYCNLPARKEMAERYRKSGKEKLIRL